ncbi:CidA/LrgA family protein [Uliginosibacterium paludis]|uniref:CidA/LrgA family protein n=1 Tax=Uliginosibacterium paludis TaxID=1615952 RepID=A0ABV2CQH7_9RHOO
MNTVAMPFTERLRKPLLVASQVTLLALIWLSADFVSRHYLPQIPSSLLGMASVLLLLALRVIRRDWLAHGAGWLISEMLLFFVPAVIAIIQYPDLIAHNGLAIMVVILGSTVCVMASTALAVDATWRLQDRLARKREGKQS